MAQRVGYFEDDVLYAEGPFVMVNANGWRVEVEMPGHHCPVLPDTSIYELRSQLGWPAGKTDDVALAERVVDQLNAMVREGKIVLDGRIWKVT